MSEQLASFLIRLAGLWCVMGLWAASIAYVFWDSGRRRLPDRRRLVWLMAALVPLAGLLGYLAIGRRGGRPGRRHPTLLKPPWPTHICVDEPTEPTLPATYWQAGAADQWLEPGDLLQVTEGPCAGERFVVEGLPLRIGRSSDCAIWLADDPAVSRRHAELYQEAELIHLRDLGSTHGTWINGRRVDDERLRRGDKVQVGNSLLVAGSAGAP